MAISSKAGNRGPMGEGPPQPQPDERKLREERILDAAATLLVRWGFRKTTIDDVAREAGVAKGTIYLHWRDKNELFRAAIMHAQQQAMADVTRRIAADPEGGLPHRLWTHGMMAALTNPLLAAILRGRTDVFQGMQGVFDPATLQQLTGDYEEYIVQLQRAGLIRADLPVSVIAFLTSALKIGIISTPEIFGLEHTPSLEQLTEAISDLIRRWLEPERSTSDTAVGKQAVVEWLEKLKAVEEHLQ
jgi:AcrR family transcriptional regulator